MKKLKLGLIGYPLKHSISKILHEKLLEIKNIQSVEYDLYEIKPENFDKEIEHLRSLYGFNITLPYKTDILNYISEIDPYSKKYESINTVKNNDSSGFKGYNTDIYGFEESIKEFNIDFKNKKILILGYGGTGKAIYSYLKEKSKEIHIALRSESKTLEQIPINPPNLTVNILTLKPNYDIIINTTPIGIYPNTCKSPVDEKIVKQCSYIFDAIYNPQETALIKLAKKNKITCQNGMNMLIYQAMQSHKIWFGSTFSQQQINKVKSIIKEILNDF